MNVSVVSGKDTDEDLGANSVVRASHTYIIGRRLVLEQTTEFCLKTKGLLANEAMKVVKMMLDTGSTTHLVNSLMYYDDGSIESCEVQIVGVSGKESAIVARKKGKITVRIGHALVVLVDVLFVENFDFTGDAVAFNEPEPQLLCGLRKIIDDNDLSVMFGKQGRVSMYRNGVVVASARIVCLRIVCVVASCQVRVYALFLITDSCHCLTLDYFLCVCLSVIFRGVSRLC